MHFTQLGTCHIDRLRRSFPVMMFAGPSTRLLLSRFFQRCSRALRVSDRSALRHERWRPKEYLEKSTRVFEQSWTC